MRVLFAHNYYQRPGGEDQVFAAEASLLERNGHDVVRYSRHNDQVTGTSPVKLAANTIWNRSTYSEFRELLRRERPEVCHFHNTFPLISPAAFYAARAEGIPVVVTLHNYRLLCLGATFMREGKVCEECTGKSMPWPGVAHRCYRGSAGASATVGLMLFTHRVLGTWSKLVDRYIALTDFARDKFVEGGLPAARIAVKPNFVEPDPGFSETSGDAALFVGRLAPEKGIETLLVAWRAMDAPVKLRIAGDGPLAGMVAEAAQKDGRIEWLGAVSREQVTGLMKQSAFLVFPSVWYEGLPLTILEAYATGLPVLAPRLGSMSELVANGETGMYFQAADGMDLARVTEWCWNHRDEVARMRPRARAKFESAYTAESNYRGLMSIYEDAGRNAPRSTKALEPSIAAAGTRPRRPA